MATMLDRISCFGSNMLSNRRKIARTPTAATALLRSSQGDAAVATLTDVSTHGCSLRSEADWLRNGRFVGIALEDGEAVQAIVRWLRDDLAGLEFLQPIPPEQSEWHVLINSPWGC